MLIAIGPQRVTVNRMFMVMMKPKHPNKSKMALNPYYSSVNGNKKMSFKVYKSPVAVVIKSIKGSPRHAK